MYHYVWTHPELEFLELLYKSPYTRHLSSTELHNIFMTEQARHLPGGDLHSSERWPRRSITVRHFWTRYRECCARVDRMAAPLQRLDLELQARMQVRAPVQAPQGQQQVLSQAPPKLQQVPVQALPRPQQVPVLAPMQAPIYRAPRPPIPPGTIRLPAGTICIPGSTTRFPHHTFLPPDQRILLPNGLILARIPTETPHHSPNPESQALQRDAAFALTRAHLQAPRRFANNHLPLPRIRQVLGRELQGRAHLNATAITRAAASQSLQYRQRSAAPRPSVPFPLRTAAISHRAAVRAPRQRQRSAAPEPSSRLSAPGSREQPINLVDDEDSSPTADKSPASDSRDQTPLFARAFQALTVDVPENENSSPTSVVRLANGRNSLPSSPIVPTGPMALGRILN
ncbi:uncharacterized protein EAF01_011471 [Botrytis porri]|uniref:Uncharacterized protein n=1 Tax=Botrytis porri TaxID=87229 RepID=A0A4Z1K5K1_9HELO|nr:uncharacterized protein EAF01_011471 [Botrytis porri]KAF7884048.1 hypothetical protein EAF01_011471 [Botrytis porri]TGO81195.1 hypothetical protein BPOR_1285g00020 [Botrytis porri]